MITPETTGAASPQIDEIILSARQVTKIYPGTVALNRVDFDAPQQGERVGRRKWRGKIDADENPGWGRTSSSGLLTLDGRTVSIRSPQDATRLRSGSFTRNSICSQT